MTSTISPLLSSVSLLLAAFGFVYNTQKDRIDGASEETKKPSDDANIRASERTAATRARTSAIWLAAVALIMWLLLLDEIEDKVDAALEHHFALSTYSTPDAVFFVAANVWLLIFLYLVSRIRKINSRISSLASAAPSG